MLEPAKNEVAVAVAKMAPPTIVTASAGIFDLTLNEWVSLATLLYICLQAFFLLRDRLSKRPRRRRGDRA